MVLLAQRPKEKRAPKEQVEVFIIRNCLGPVVGVEGMQHLELGSRVKVTEEVARQLRLRDIGGIVVIDFIEAKAHQVISPDRVCVVPMGAASNDRLGVPCWCRGGDDSGNLIRVFAAVPV